MIGDWSRRATVLCLLGIVASTVAVAGVQVFSIPPDADWRRARIYRIADQSLFVSGRHFRSLTWAKLADEVGVLGVHSAEGSRPDVLYIAPPMQRPGRIQKSMDGGKNWIELVSGPTFPIAQILVAPDDPHTAHVVGDESTWVTRDGGLTWSGIDLPCRIRRLRWSTNGPSRLWALCERNLHDGALFVSDDAGVTWDDRSADLPFDVVGSGPNQSRRRAVPADIAWSASGDPFWLSTSVGLFRLSGDGPSTAVPLSSNDGPWCRLAGSSTGKVVAGCGEDTSRLYATVEGDTWAPLDLPSDARWAEDFAVTPNVILISGDGNRLYYRESDSDRFRALNHGVTSSSKIRGLTFLNDAQGTILAAVESLDLPTRPAATAIYRSVDQGVTWTPTLKLQRPFDSSINFRVSPHDASLVFVFGPGNAWFGTSAHHVSRDGGITWEDMGEWRTTDLEFDPIRPSKVWQVGGVNEGTVFVSGDSGRVWQELAQGLDVHGWYLVVNAVDGNALLAGCCHDPVVWKTEDGGWTWAKLPLTDPVFNPRGKLYLGGRPTLDPVLFHGERILLVVSMGEDDRRFFRSEDRGTTWRELAFILPEGTAFPFPYFAVDRRGPQPVVWMLLVAPAKQENKPGTPALFRSIDFGDTWSEVRMPTGFYMDRQVDTFLVFPKAQPERVLLSRHGGIFETSDGGNGWLPFPPEVVPNVVPGTIRESGLAIGGGAPAVDTGNATTSGVDLLRDDPATLGDVWMGQLAKRRPVRNRWSAEDHSYSISADEMFFSYYRHALPDSPLARVTVRFRATEQKRGGPSIGFKLDDKSRSSRGPEFDFDTKEVKIESVGLPPPDPPAVTVPLPMGEWQTAVIDCGPTGMQVTLNESSILQDARPCKVQGDFLRIGVFSGGAEFGEITFESR